MERHASLASGLNIWHQLRKQRDIKVTFLSFPFCDIHEWTYACAPQHHWSLACLIFP